MRNLVKQRNIVNTSGETRVINSNVKMEEILGKFNNPEDFSPGLFATELEVEGFEGEENPGVEQLVQDNPDGISYSEEEMPEEMTAPEPEIPQIDMDAILEKEEQILAEARARAEEEAEAIKQQALEDATMQAEETLTLRRQELEEEFQQAQLHLQQSYEQQISSIEADMVDTFLDVFKEVLHVEVTDYRDIMMDLIKSTLLKADNPKELSIQVGEENFEQVKEELPALKELLGEDAKLEILKNSQLGPKDCKIETDFGIYDCGFDVQLKNLCNRIRLLSQWKNKE